MAAMAARRNQSSQNTVSAWPLYFGARNCDDHIGPLMHHIIVRLRLRSAQRRGNILTIFHYRRFSSTCFCFCLRTLRADASIPTLIIPLTSCGGGAHLYPVLIRSLIIPCSELNIESRHAFPSSCQPQFRRPTRVCPIIALDSSYHGLDPRNRRGLGKIYRTLYIF